jgi:hypothetical protein
MNSLSHQHFSPKNKVPYSFAPNDPVEYGQTLDLVFDQVVLARQGGYGDDIDQVCEYLGVLVYPLHKASLSTKLSLDKANLKLNIHHAKAPFRLPKR